jgi:hypothetical protein
MARPATLNQRHIHALALETGASARTVRRWLCQLPVSPLAAYALAAAAAKLKIAQPRKAARVKAKKA